jgi:hypothetical protein
MSTRELIVKELELLHEGDLDRLLDYVRSLREAHTKTAVSVLAAESALTKDWLTPEEDEAWARL